MMYRTQVYFPREILEDLRREAFEQRKTLASVIREKVTRSMKKKVLKKPSEKEIKKRLKLLDEISKLNLPTKPWAEMEEEIEEAKDPLHFERKQR